MSKAIEVGLEKRLVSAQAEIDRWPGKVKRRVLGFLSKSDSAWSDAFNEFENQLNDGEILYTTPLSDGTKIVYIASKSAPEEESPTT